MSKEKRLVIQSGSIFDSIKGKMLLNQTIVIEGRAIVWLGDEGNYEKEANDEVINAEGKTILPGMIEAHVHLVATGNPQSEREYLRTKKDMYNYIALDNAQKHLIGGFTCVRDCGGYKGILSSLRRVFDMGLLAGPRLSVSETGIWQWGNQESIGPEALIEFDRQATVVTAGVDNITYAVRDQKKLGAGFIKTATTGGVLHGMESKVNFSLWTNEELESLRKEAHRLGMHVACHAHGDTGIDSAIRAKFDTIEHGSYVSEASADLMVKHGTYLIPTRSAIVGLASKNIYNQMPSEVQQKITEVYNQAKDNYKIALEKGVKMAIGTDAGTPGNYHGNTGKEVVLMVKDIGMSPVQALQAATIEGAKAIWMEDQIGSISKGKFADLIICEGNPLEDITLIENCANFSHVIKDGKVMVENGKITYFSPLKKNLFD